MNMHKKIISFNDIFAIKDVDPKDISAIKKQLELYSHMLDGVEADNKRTKLYKDLIATINKLLHEINFKIITLGFIRMGPGEFTMGSTKEKTNPEHQVTITRPFEIAQHMVTQEEFLEFDKDHKSHLPENPQSPADSVSWYQAIGYCIWLSLKADDIEQEHKDAIKDLAPENYMKYAFEHPEAKLYRLPTEAEWEYAFRNEGRSTPEEIVALYEQLTKDEKGGDLIQVYSKAPIRMELYRTYGIRWEICYDRYSVLTEDSKTDPRGPNEGDEHVVRKTSWLEPKDLMITGRSRGPGHLYEASFMAGFRVARNRE
jgi:sulfatase modifying factor 1